MMTLAQVEERLPVLEQAVERLATLEKVVARLQTRVKSESQPGSQEQKEEAEEDLIPGTEYDLVVTVPPQESFRFKAHIVSIQTPPADLGLSATNWDLFGSENDDE